MENQIVSLSSHKVNFLERYIRCVGVQTAVRVDPSLLFLTLLPPLEKLSGARLFRASRLQQRKLLTGSIPFKPCGFHISSESGYCSAMGFLE